MGVGIRGIAHALPAQTLTNDDLQRENPRWDLRRVETRVGVRCRYVAAEDQTALDLGRAACQKLLAAHPGLAEQIDALLFCTETADHRLPPNACILQGQLGLSERVLALDIGLGCSGYPYCLALARGLLMSGAAHNVLIVNADTYSKFIPKHDQSTRVLFGDAAAASWIGPCPDGQGVLDFLGGTAGEHYQKFLIPTGGCRQPRREDTEPGSSLDTIHMDGMGILAFVNSKVPVHLRELLQRNQLSVESVDLFLFHQASRMVLDSLAQLLGIRADQGVSNLAEVGNTVSASLPILLQAAWEAGRLRAGRPIVLCGFGLGLSWGSVVVRWPD